MGDIKVEYFLRKKNPAKKWISINKQGNRKMNALNLFTRNIARSNLSSILDRFSTKKVFPSTINAIFNCIKKRSDRILGMIKDPNKKYSSAKMYKLFLKSLSN